MARKRGDTEKLERASPGFGAMMAAYDWKEAMGYAKFAFADVAEVLYAHEGENEGDHWQLVARLRGGKFGWLSAGCDCSGWDCQSGGSSGIHKSRELAVAAMARYRPSQKTVPEEWT